MESIPLDILENGILPRLPAKSLMRFKCVSKPWLALISSHEFIHRHLSYALTSTTNDFFILTGNNSCLYSFDLGLPEAPAVKVPSFGMYTSVVGSCNGLLCIESHMLYSLHLLNPSTGSYLQIPSFIPPRYGALNYGLGYDSRNDDYKLVRLVESMPYFPFHDPIITRIVEVFSLSTDSWEVIERTSPPQDCMGDHENGALIRNSLLHWKFWCPQQGGRYRIRCFDICEKQWTHDVPFPDSRSFQHDRGGVLDFGALDGKLYLSIKNQLQSAVDIWVMNEYCMKDSWVKLFQVSDLRVFQSLRASPIANRSLKGQILLSSTMNKTEHNILWYNIQDETVETAEFNGVANIIEVNVCKSSLVNVRGGSQCEYETL